MHNRTESESKSPSCCARRFPLRGSGYTKGMAWKDDDDWVGEPPEGHYTRDRAKPDFWRTQRPPGLILGALALVVIILVLVLILM
jgi:hypothetical protein